MKNKGADLLPTYACAFFGIAVGNFLIGIVLLLNAVSITRESLFAGMFVCLFSFVASLSLDTQMRLWISSTMVGMSATMYMEWTSKQSTVDTYTVQFIEGLPTFIIAIILIAIYQMRQRTIQG